MKILLIIILVATFSIGCDSDSELLAPYDGQRPLTILKITQSFSPDIQWVGGRIAAAGINRGSKAALDNTLIWIQTAETDTISSYITVGLNTAENEIQQFGGVPLDSLPTKTTLTFWLAKKTSFDAGLDPARSDEFTLLDTTFVFNYLIGGAMRSQDVDSLLVYRDQKLLSDKFYVDWRPRDVNVRQIALSPGSNPGWIDLLWHVRLTNNSEPGLTPMVLATIPPARAEVVVPWGPLDTIAPVVHTMWMTLDNWNSSFMINSRGLAFLQFRKADILP